MFFREGLMELVPVLNTILVSGGPGGLWAVNLGDIPTDWEMGLSDISPTPPEWYRFESPTSPYVPTGIEAVVQAMLPHVIINGTSEDITVYGIWLALGVVSPISPDLLLGHLELSFPVTIPPTHGANLGPAPGLGNC